MRKPGHGALGETNCVGTTIRRSAPGNQGLTLGFARRISPHSQVKWWGMSVRVSSFELLTICTTPITSSSGATSKRCVATGSGSEGAGGGGGGGVGSECFTPLKREHAVARIHKEAATAARI